MHDDDDDDDDDEDRRTCTHLHLQGLFESFFDSYASHPQSANCICYPLEPGSCCFRA